MSDSLLHARSVDPVRAPQLFELCGTRVRVRRSRQRTVSTTQTASSWRPDQNASNFSRELDTRSRALHTSSWSTLTNADLKRRLSSYRAWCARLKVAFASGSPDDSESTEASVWRRMQAPLREASSPRNRSGRSRFFTFATAQGSPSPTRVSCPRHLSLLTRVLQNLRSSVILAERGHTMQSWTVAASAFSKPPTPWVLSPATSRGRAEMFATRHWQLS